MSGSRPRPGLVVVDDQRLFGLPDLAAHSFTEFDAPAELAFEKTHADLHLHQGLTRFQQVNVPVARAGQQRRPVQDGFEEFLLVQQIEQADGGFVQGG